MFRIMQPYTGLYVFKDQLPTIL